MKMRKIFLILSIAVIMICSVLLLSSCDQAAALVPQIGENGNWWIGGSDTGVSASGEKGDSGVTPIIGENGNWWIDGSDTGVSASGEKGDTGVAPSIGENGNWWIGGNDTGVSASGEKGDNGVTPSIGENGNWWIGDEDTGLLAGHVHDYYDYSVGLAPSCTSMGYSVSACKICGDEKYSLIKSTGHAWDDGKVMQKPTVSQDGITLYTCAVCGETKAEFVKSEFSIGLEYSPINDDSEYAVMGIGECEDSEIIIPDEYNGLPVTEIGEKAFYGCGSIVSIELPDTIKTICDKAFSECELLINVKMPDDVEIGIDIFRGSINVSIELKHTLVYVEAKEPSCTEVGNIAYYFCEKCNDYYKDEEGTVRLYDVIIPNSHSFVEGYCEICDSAQADVLITDLEETVTHLGKFSLGTLENAIGLPETINVTTAVGETHSLTIVWDLSMYDKSKVGEYTIVGHIQAPGLFFAEGLSNKVEATIEIVDYMKGTADIVFVLDISGSMGDEVANVKNNIVEFAQKLEEAGVSARWSAITYSDHFDVPGDPKEKTTVLMNGATPWFTAASAYESAIASIELANGGDIAEAAVDGLMMANSLEKRQDARVFYILLTDANYKNNNDFGVSNMTEAVDIINANGANVSVITSSSYYGTYSYVNETTGGIMSDIYGDFANDLFESLVPIIYEDVIS